MTQLTTQHQPRHTESLSKFQGGQRPCQSGAFFMPEMGSYPSLAGVETRHTTPARENRDAVSLNTESAPGRPHKGSLSLKNFKEVI